MILVYVIHHAEERRATIFSQLGHSLSICGEYCWGYWWLGSRVSMHVIKERSSKAYYCQHVSLHCGCWQFGGCVGLNLQFTRSHTISSDVSNTLHDSTKGSPLHPAGWKQHAVSSWRDFQQRKSDNKPDFVRGRIFHQ